MALRRKILEPNLKSEYRPKIAYLGRNKYKWNGYQLRIRLLISLQRDYQDQHLKSYGKDNVEYGLRQGQNQFDEHMPVYQMSGRSTYNADADST